MKWPTLRLESPPLAGMLFITASHTTALFDGVRWVQPSSQFHDSSVIEQEKTPVTFETDGTWPKGAIFWPLLNIFVFYGAISMRSSLHLPTFFVALLLSIPPLLLPYDVYVKNPSTGIFIYTVYLYTCRLVARYSEWRSGLANTCVSLFRSISTLYLC